MTESNKPISLGEYLRSEREKRGLSVDQVASATKIGVKILYALEADRFDELPALPFVRGFVKNYAKFIGLSPEQILRDYDTFLHARMKARPDRSRGHSGYAFERPEGEQSRQMLWAIMGTMIVLGGLVILIFKPSLKHRHRGHVEKMQAMNATPSPSPSLAAVIAALPSPGVSPAPSSTVAVTPPPASPVPSPMPSVVAAAPVPAPAPSPSPTEKFIAPKVPLVFAPKVPVPSPTPVPSVVAAVPTPSPAPSVVAAVIPTPVPEPTAVPVPGASPSPKPDPLQTGVEYDPKEIKYKILVKAHEDVWVRYRCDDKTMMKFVLRKDRILVLRGKSVIRFQAAKPESVSLGVNYREYVGMLDLKNLQTVRDTSTVQFGSQPGETLEKVLGKEEPLPGASEGVNP